MFRSAYWGSAYWRARYWQPGGDVVVPPVVEEPASGGWPTAEEWQRHRRMLERARKIEERVPEAQDAKVPVRAVKVVKSVARSDLAALANMPAQAQEERLRQELEAARLVYREVYAEFLRAELERFREEEAVMMMLAISATVH